MKKPFDSSFHQGLALRILSYFVQTVFPIYAIYEAGLHGLNYWVALILFWTLGGIGSLLPYIKKLSSTAFSTIIVLISLISFFSQKYLLIFLGLIWFFLSGLTGKVVYISYNFNRLKGIISYMRGVSVGLFLSILLTLLGYLRFFASVGLYVSALLISLSVVVLYFSLNSTPKDGGFEKLSLIDLLKALKGNKVYFRTLANSLAWSAFSSYLYYVLYSVVKFNYKISLVAVFISILSSFLTRFILEPSQANLNFWEKASVLLYSVSFLGIFLSIITRGILLLALSSALLGISHGILPPLLIYESLSSLSENRYRGYLAYNAYTGVGEFLSNVFFGVMLAFSILMYFYLIPFIILVIVIFIDNAK